MSGDGAEFSSAGADSERAYSWGMELVSKLFGWAGSSRALLVSLNAYQLISLLGGLADVNVRSSIQRLRLRLE